MSQRVTVAAVCYRRRDGALEFLLVRTTGGAKWTFPKGHVEEGDTPYGAAAREACEEAGVHGIISPEPLTEYAYGGGSDGGGERRVTAYLLEVGSQREPRKREHDRDPTWFDPAEAEQKLGEGGREERYRLEHARVLAAAVDALAHP